jgi:hypothetical protein
MELCSSQTSLDTLIFLKRERIDLPFSSDTQQCQGLSPEEFNDMFISNFGL